MWQDTSDSKGWGAGCAPGHMESWFWAQRIHGAVFEGEAKGKHSATKTGAQHDRLWLALLTKACCCP